MNHRLRTLVWLALAALLLVAPVTLAAPASAPSPAGLAPFDPYIMQRIEKEGQADFYVVLKVQADLSAAEALPTKEAKGRYVFNALSEVAAKTQGPILALLKTERVEFKSFRIRNMVRVTGDAALLLKLAARPDVAEIIYEYPAIPDVAGKVTAGQAAGTETPEWGIARVGAPAVWALGIIGAGAVVGDLDTGVQWDHPALINAYRGNLGGGTYDHNYNWYDGGVSLIPTDYDSHGTHTMGTMVGDDGTGNQIGMAPGAKWIACPGIGSPNVGTFDCFEWFLAPTDLMGNNPQPDLAPHVINNSWSSSGTNYHPIIQTLTAAGIFYAKSAGNTGSACGTITNPGQWPEVTAAAAFASGDTIASFSSRGPVTIGHDVMVKPDIAAPGVNVRSSIPGSSYGSMQGTSMASPHVAGAVALLVSARPDLAGKVDILQMLLKDTAEPKTSTQCPPYTDIPNDVWGWGILDIEAAVLRAQAMGMGAVQGTVTDADTSAPIADAELVFEDTTTAWPLHDISEADGTYERPLPAATYDVSASHYGYTTASIPGLIVLDAATSTLDIALDPAPVWTVAGQVTEEDTGDPLKAFITFDETPVTVASDASTGLYSAEVAEGTWWMEVRSPGHTGEDRQVDVTSDLTEDFVLTPIENYYMRTGDDCGPAFDWRDASGGTLRNLTDDSYVYVTLPAGEDFTFYGQTYTALYVVSNGIVTFGTANNKWSGPIPDPATPNNGIYAFSTDLDPLSGAQGQIYTDYQEDRYFVIEWYEVEHFPSGSPETFEIILDLDTDKVTIQYHTINNVADATSGVENSTGTEATQYAYADPVLIDDGKVIDFYPMFGTPPPSGGLGTLTGQVTDLDTGAPIGNASVTAVAFTTGEVVDLTADLNGFYTTTVCADWYDLTASAPAYQPTTIERVPVLSDVATVQDIALQHTLADLWLLKTGPMAAQPGDLIAYTVSYGSEGPDTALSGEIVDTLPASVTWISGGTYDPMFHNVTWQLTDLVSGSLGSETLVVQLSDTFTGTQICNSATIAITGLNPPIDLNPDNDTAMACTTMGQTLRVFLPLVMKSYP